MANLTETPTYPVGIYRIETTDPVIGGEDGIDNIQAKLLANRTAYLKVRADQVDAAAGGEENLAARLDSIEAMAEAVGPEMTNATVGLVKFALDQAGQANAGIRFIREIWTQRGWAFFINRGVITGCAVTKSTTATRNLNLSAGRCFAGGHEWPVGEGVNAASVPSNTGSGAISVVAYLYPDGVYNYSLAVTAEDEEVPEDGIPIYNLIIPAANTDLTDPDISEVTITDVRRLEPNFPSLLDFPVRVYVPITVLSNEEYNISLHTYGGRLTGGLDNCVVTLGQAPNGFMLELRGVDDDVYVLWQLFKLDN